MCLRHVCLFINTTTNKNKLLKDETTKISKIEIVIFLIAHEIWKAAIGLIQIQSTQLDEMLCDILKI